MTVSKASMLEALQEYFDTRVGEKMPKQKVTDCELEKEHGYQSGNFEVTLEEVKAEEAAK